MRSLPLRIQRKRVQVVRILITTLSHSKNPPKRSHLKRSPGAAKRNHLAGYQPSSRKWPEVSSLPHREAKGTRPPFSFLHSAEISKIKKSRKSFSWVNFQRKESSKRKKCQCYSISEHKKKKKNKFPFVFLLKTKTPWIQPTKSSLSIQEWKLSRIKSYKSRNLVHNVRTKPGIRFRS